MVSLLNYYQRRQHELARKFDSNVIYVIRVVYYPTSYLVCNYVGIIKGDNMKKIDEIRDAEAELHYDYLSSASIIKQIKVEAFKEGWNVKDHLDNSALKLAIKVLDLTSRTLNGIKSDLEASVYTLTDDEFEKVYFVRDKADEALATILALRGKL